MYCIEGNIGAGKSTLMKCLKEEFPCFLEPVEKWTLLEKFYSDPKTYAFSFQFQVLLTQYNQIKEINKINRPCFMERNPWTSKNIFIEQMKKNNFWTDTDEISYNNFYNTIDMKIETIFFLDLDPTICAERIKLRNRFEERNISLDYLKQLDSQYKTQFDKCPFNVKFISVFGKTPYEIAEEIKSLIMI